MENINVERHLVAFELAFKRALKDAVKSGKISSAEGVKIQKIWDSTAPIVKDVRIYQRYMHTNVARNLSRAQQHNLRLILCQRLVNKQFGGKQINLGVYVENFREKVIPNSKGLQHSLFKDAQVLSNQPMVLNINGKPISNCSTERIIAYTLLKMERDSSASLREGIFFGDKVKVGYRGNPVVSMVVREPRGTNDKIVSLMIKERAIKPTGISLGRLRELGLAEKAPTAPANIRTTEGGVAKTIESFIDEAIRAANKVKSLSEGEGTAAKILRSFGSGIKGLGKIKR
jgi:hypothetical protein